MDKQLLKKNLLKFLLCNLIISIIMYGLYWLARDFVYPSTYVPAPMIVWNEVFRLGIILLIVTCTIGALFRFKINKETWIVCNVLSIFVGAICGILYEFQNPLVFLFLPFSGVHMICQYSVFDMELSFGYTIILNTILFCIYQNMALLPSVIEAYIRKNITQGKR